MSAARQVETQTQTYLLLDSLFFRIQTTQHE